MKLVDTNVLVYATNSSAQHHQASRAWLEATLSGTEGMGFAWLAMIGFVRIVTNPRVMPAPISVDQAMESLQDWLGQPSARVLSPTARHPFVLRDLLREVGTGGNLVNDAHLAALAIEHRAEIVSYDTDFARFPGVRWGPPAA